MADGSNPAFALAIAQAIARGQGTPQQRSAFLGQVARQMQANAAAQAALHGQQAPPGAGGFHPHPIGPEFPGQGHPQMPLPTLPGGQLGPAEGGGLIPGQGHPQMPLPPLSGGQGLEQIGGGPGLNNVQGPGLNNVYAPGAGLHNVLAPGPPTGGAGLAPPKIRQGVAPGYENPGGGFQGVNPGGPMQPSPGSPLPIGRTGPVRPIGPARPPRRGTTQIGGRTYGTTTFNGHPVGF